MKILHVDSSFLGSQSVSRELTAAAVAQLRRHHPGATVVHRDLAAAPPAHLDGATLAAMRATDPAGLSSADQAAAASAEALLQEFLAADVVVVGAPMYNFSVPTQLKAWIDRIAQAGRTFKYTAEGPVGLAGGKRVVILSSRGGAYAGTPFEAALDHQEAYLRAVFGFLGITDLTVIRAEGVNLGPEARSAAVAGALGTAGRLAPTSAAA